MSRLAATIAMLKDIRDTTAAGIDALIEDLETGGLPQGEYSGETPDPDPDQGTDPNPTPDPTPDPVPTPDPAPGPDPVPAQPPSGTGVKTEAEFLTALGNAGAGDVIPLQGQFPAMTLSDFRFAGGKLTLRGQGVVMGGLALRSCANLSIEGIEFEAPGPVYAGGALKYLVTGDAQTSDIDVIGCDMRARADSANFRSWSLADWKERVIGGAFFEGPRITLQDNAALGVNFGFALNGPDGKMLDNRVCGFSGDSFRSCGNRFYGRGNWATDAYLIDQNHPDGIQAFGRPTTSTLISDQVWEDTIQMEYSTLTDERGSLAAWLQLIGYHNGPYSDIVFRRFVGGTSSHNAYHINNCSGHVGDKIMMFALPSKNGGIPKTRVPANASLTDVYLEGAFAGSAPPTGKPDYSKLPAFRVPALRGNKKPDLRAILGW